jgi:hypothetical protein
LNIRVHGLLLGLFALSACRVTTLAPSDLKPKVTIPEVVAPMTTKASGAATTPAAQPPRPMVGTRLTRPPSGTTVLAGQVAIDASYVVRAGGGSLIANNGSGVLAAGVSSLAADGRLLASDGTAIAESSGNIISENGGAIVANNSSNIVANNGGGLTGKTKRQLLQAKTAEYGAMLPAAGIQIGLRSLSTGLPVSIGLDGHGGPVYTVYTNLKGGYELYVPTSEQGNLLVEARVPKTADPRQAYDILATPGTAGVVDEDTALATRFIREILIRRVTTFFVEDPAVVLCEIDSSSSYSDGLKTFLSAALTEFHDRGVKAGVTSSAAQVDAVQALATRCTDLVLANVPFDTVVLGGQSTVTWGNGIGETKEPAVLAITEFLRSLRTHATFQLNAHPDFFDQQPYFQSANACDPGRYVIKKPADFNSFLIQEYFGNNSDPGTTLGRIAFQSIGAGAADNGADNAKKVDAALDALVETFSRAVFTGSHGEKDAVFALIDAFDPKATLAVDLALPTANRLPCPRPSGNTRLTLCAGTATGAATPSSPLPSR